ncbi:MAG: T9SS type A sorting domain-containing protein [Flavobacteriales bacterium]|nr:T9SS type A sorting domain-containing protein [Flavobacteriales bacterium]
MWIQDGVGSGTGAYVLEWQLLTCPVPTASAATGITNNQAGASFSAPAGNYIVEWGPAATFTTPGPGAAAGLNGTVIATTASPTLITGLSSNTQYRYFVRRDCGSGNFSPNSSGIAFTTTNAPTAVANGSCGNNVAITDNGCASNTYALASIAISGQPNALGTNVGLSSVELILTHTYRSDLIISLVSPGGQEFSLINQKGGSSDNFGNNGSCPTAVFRLIAGGAALTAIPATTANVTGNYAPEQPLSSFNSGNPNGNWVLKICDNAGVDVGALRHVRLNFQPIDCLGAFGGSAMPGTACNDNNACTINDIWSTGCACAGTFQDTDGDGTCNADDGCPNDPNKIAPGQCGCGVADADNDNDGTANCNDGCPNDPLKVAPGICGCGVADTDSDSDGTADCNDGCPNDPLKVLPGICGCGMLDIDNDNDGLADCIDPCPFLPFAQNGDACDANPGPGYTMGQITNCACAPVACSTNLHLELQTDGMSNITWELRQQGTNALVQSGGGFYPPTPSYSENTCLPDGCYYLKVTDGEGDGILNGGYILRIQGSGGKRLIDNRNNFTSGSISQIAGNEGFCLPMGTDRLIFLSCDRLDWSSGEFIVANDNPEVSAQWGVGNQADDGYEMWFFNPNGGYSFRRFHSHAVSDGFGPANAIRACHIQLNNWAGSNHIQTGVLLNVRVRSRVNGVNAEWGQACRFKLDPLRAQCPLTKLLDQPGNPFFSCGATRSWGNGNYVHARPITGANRYQFRFRIPAENFSVVRTSTNYFVQLNWSGMPLQACKTYEVDVRVSMDGGLTWCTDFIPPALTDPWGDVCLLTIACAAQGGGQNMAGEQDAVALHETLSLFPNPNRGDQVQVRVSDIGNAVETVGVDIRDAFGKLVCSRTVPVANGVINSSIDLEGGMAAGLYTVSVTIGDQVITERLVVQP